MASTGLINLFGIESPGLTSSLAIADHVGDAGRRSDGPLRADFSDRNEPATMRGVCELDAQYRNLRMRRSTR